MATLKDKMKLYATKPVVSVQKDSTEQGKSLEMQDLYFEDYNFKFVNKGFYIYTKRFANPQFGNKLLSAYLPWKFSGMLALSSILADDVVSPDEVLFLDTETTGLSRTGATIAFLIGTARFEKNSLVTELLFIQNPIGEGAALDYLTSLQKKFRYLVSYNGKSFDIPLIRNRMILNRKKGLRVSYHFDLLHIFRKLFVKGTVASWAQQEMEKEVLHFHRTDDLPGSQIPQIYFDYVKYKYDGGLAQVFKHNEMDVLGLTFLFLEAIRIYDNRDVASISMQSGLARILLRNKNNDEAIAILCELLKTTNDLTQIQYRDRMLLAKLYRQKKNTNQAINIYQSLVNDFDCPWARMSLAKIYEHKIREYNLALSHIEYLLVKSNPVNKDHAHISGNVVKNPWPSNKKYVKNDLQKNEAVFKKPTRGIYSHAGLTHRISRIKKKMQKQGPSS